MDIRTYLQDNLLLFDGAMGTYYTQKGGAEPCEMANLTDPQRIYQIHREYVGAGCKALKTNTFSANRPTMGDRCVEVIDAGFLLASKAAGPDCWVFADIGPVPPEMNAVEEYRFLAGRFLEVGAANFLFETQADPAGLHEAASYIKSVNPEAFILVSFAAQPDGFTQAGRLARDLLRAFAVDKNIDAVGLNCMASAGHMSALLEQIGPLSKPLAVLPNAGYPTVLGRRTIYHGDPRFFGTELRELAAKGAAILGGCCGTTPLHIAHTARALQEPIPKRVTVPAAPAAPAPAPPAENQFWNALRDPARKPVAVELDPPEAADVSKFMAGARELRDSGASVITIADCPIARARMDSSILACKLRRELHVEALPHMTCRDRNLNATKALLLGLCAEDVHNVLVVTGDPIPSARRDEVKSVYNFNSRMLSRYICTLNEESLPIPFRIFGALNLNARNFKTQLELAKDKEENGVTGFLTQPVLTHQALENLKLARETLQGKILGGIIPIVSHRNAVFMNSEVSGITVAPEIIDRYEGLDREQGEALALELSRQIARDMTPYVDGYYLITPFGRTGLIARILEAMRKDGLI